VWLGIENEDDLDVPLPEETLIRFQTFRLDSGDLARRLAKMWERLESVADIAISNLLSELLVVAASGVGPAEFEGAAKTQASNLVITGYVLGRIAQDTDEVPLLYSRNFSGQHAENSIRAFVEMFNARQLFEIVPTSISGACMAASQSTSIETPGAQDPELITWLKAGLVFGGLGLALGEQKFIDEQALLDRVERSSSNPRQESLNPIQMKAEPMDIDIRNLVGDQYANIAIKVARPALPGSEHLTFVSSVKDNLSKSKAFDRSTRKAMQVSESGLPRFAIAGLNGVFSSHVDSISTSMGMQSEDALRDFFGFAIREAFPKISEDAVQECLLWIPKVRDVNGSVEAHYQLARYAIPALPPMTNDWAVQSSRNIAVMGAMVGYIAGLNHIIGTVWKY
jgi:hypothetical protein